MKQFTTEDCLSTKCPFNVIFVLYLTTLNGWQMCEEIFQEV